jgi:hypothetical protein
MKMVLTLFLLNFFNILCVWSRLTITFCKISGVIDVAWKWTVLTQLNNHRQRQSHSFIAIQKKRLLLPTHVCLSYLYPLRVGVWFYVGLTWGMPEAWVTSVLFVTAKRCVFRNMTPRSVVEVCQRFRGAYYLHEQDVLFKCRYLSTRLYGFAIRRRQSPDLFSFWNIKHLYTSEVTPHEYRNRMRVLMSTELWSASYLMSMSLIIVGIFNSACKV